VRLAACYQTGRLCVRPLGQDLRAGRLSDERGDDWDSLQKGCHKAVALSACPSPTKAAAKANARTVGAVAHQRARGS
jgi:hypothetical protein